MARVLFLVVTALIQLCLAFPFKEEAPAAERSMRQLASIVRDLRRHRAVTREKRDLGQGQETIQAPSPICMKLVTAFENLNRAAANTDYALILEAVKTGFTQDAGIDLNDEAQATKFFCELAEVDSVEQLAVFVMMDEAKMKRQYPGAVVEIRHMLVVCRLQGDNPDNRPEDQIFFRAAVPFLEAIQEAGLLNLT